MATNFQGSFKNSSTSNPGNISPQISLMIFYLHLLPKMILDSNVPISYFWQNSITFCTCKKKLPISKSSEIFDEISPETVQTDSKFRTYWYPKAQPKFNPKTIDVFITKLTHTKSVHNIVMGHLSLEIHWNIDHV